MALTPTQLKAAGAKATEASAEYNLRLCARLLAELVSKQETGDDARTVAQVLTDAKGDL